MKIHEAARKILRRENKPLHIQVLAELIRDADLFQFGAQNPPSALDTALARRSRGVNISKHSGEFIFYRAAPATYGLLEFLEANPGRGIYEVLGMLYNIEKEPSGSLLSQIDNALAAEGRLVRSIRSSILFYMTRRLISFACHRRRYYRKNGIDDTIPLRRDVDDYLENKTAVDANFHGLLVELLIEAARYRDRQIPNGLRKKLLDHAKDNDLKCYLCGCELDFENTGRDNSVQLDHVWPRSLGGPSSEINLKVACHKCNHQKASYMDSSDAHFERICFITDESESSFLRELNHCDKLTLLAKNECKCSICDAPAETAGILFVNRADRGDILHYFNTVNTCSEHGRSER